MLRAMPVKTIKIPQGGRELHFFLPPPMEKIKNINKYIYKKNYVDNLLPIGKKISDLPPLLGNFY